MIIPRKASSPPDIDLLFDPRLIAAGLPPRLVLLYGTLRFFADGNRNCEATRYGIARMIGLRSHSQASRLLRELRSLSLVEWTRAESKISLREWGHATSTYHVLEPDVARLSEWKARHG